MKAIAESGGGFETFEADTYPGRCISVIDCGTKINQFPNDRGEYLPRHQIMLVWETPTETWKAKDGTEAPRTISKFYTLSLNEKAILRKDVQTWRGAPLQTGQEFDIKNLLDQPCLLSIGIKDNGKNHVDAVLKPMKGVDIAPRHNSLTYFSFDEFDEITLAGMSEGMQKIIKESDEYKALPKVGVQVPDGPPAPPPIGESDMPF